MKQRGIEPDAITCGAFVSVCEETKQVERVFDVLAEMKQRSLELTVITCGALINACEKKKTGRKRLASFR